MCGFSGVYCLKEGKVIDRTVLERSAFSIRHRGPDDQGIWSEGRIGLTHRRLSILDISDAGHQPFVSADERFVMVFNGEIYNYREFIPELNALGYSFRSQSDTEVLLALWMHYGTAMLPRLNGMWAFAIWDKREQELFLCRDRMGVKPLYVAKDEKNWYFGSEPKALFSLGFEKRLNAEALKEHFIFRYLEGEKTLFTGMTKLLPGHWMKIKENEMYSYRWWNLMESSNALSVPQDPLTWFDEIFHDSLRYRMVSDVPVGVLLSAGLDSSSVALGLKENREEHIHTFTIRFHESEHNEAHIASRFSEALGYPNHHLLLEGSELLEAVQKASYAADQPLVHQNDGHLVGISALAANHVKVLLSGEGADEIMGGYVRYKPFRYFSALKWLGQILPLVPVKSHRLSKLQRFLFTSDADTLMRWSASNFFPSDLKALGMDFEERSSYREQVVQESYNLNHNDTIKRLLYLEQHTYLQSLLDRNDTTTMMSGIECREPFLDHRLVEGLMRLPSQYFIRGKKGKYLMSHSMGKRLPSEIRHFRKIGLSVPWASLLRKNPTYREYLLRSEELEYYLGFSLKMKVDEFLKGNNEHQMLIRYLFFYNIWKETFNWD